MDLQELSRRSGFSVRKLRYCLDHGLVPGLKIDLKENEVGRPRKFSSDVGFGVVCAALLQEQGLPHPKIRLFLRGITADIEKVQRILQNNEPAAAHLGDGQNFRLIVGAALTRPENNPWFIPDNPVQLDQRYQPRVTVTLDLGAIRDQIFQEPRAADRRERRKS